MSKLQQKHRNTETLMIRDSYQQYLFPDMPLITSKREFLHKARSKTSLGLQCEKINILINKIGFENAWYSILATHIYQLHQSPFDYLLKQQEFANAVILDSDILYYLSIGEIATLYEYSLSYLNRNKRAQEGQYFTPDDVAQVMAKRSLFFPPDKIWVDPCSGIGNLSFWLIKLQSNPESFLTNQLYLIDKDALALFIARTLFTLSFQNKSKNLFIEIAPRFIVADFLFASELPAFDFAILNPPYVEVESDNRFKTAKTRNLYAYFLERVINLSRGFVSITPQTFTHGQRFKTLRQLLIENMKDISIYCFDNVPDTIFKGIKFGSTNTNKTNSIRASITVAKSESKFPCFKITPLLRWRTKERKKILESIDDYLTNVEPSVDIFPKIQKELLYLYYEVKKVKKTLVNLVSTNPTQYKLVIPTTPRYFISALRTEVNRSSFRILYFYNKKDYDLAYILLNSSYAYWWWRINDGGMTISEKTLLSLPIPDNIPVNSQLISKIEQSELTNRVFKKNAGKNNENVKHKAILIGEINQTLFLDFASALNHLHNNSVITI
ncbi:MAG: Eco57I restriction-modification methylase domain-containing protein [Candidatus Omnitrophica bacterium]|nr:Eco57I restriction-modification methylase domain-containing protein [Candidatus Omnitrophota bacterium]